MGKDVKCICALRPQLAIRFVADEIAEPECLKHLHPFSLGFVGCDFSGKRTLWLDQAFKTRVTPQWRERRIDPEPSG